MSHSTRAPHGPIDSALALVYAAADHPRESNLSSLRTEFAWQVRMIPNYQHRVYLEAFADEVNKLSTDPFELKRVANDLQAWQTRTFGYSSR
jgi:hypothetical protein